MNTSKLRLSNASRLLIVVILVIEVFVFGGGCENASKDSSLREFSSSMELAPTSKWPKTLRIAIEEAAVAGVDVGSFKVYQLNYDEFFFEFHSSVELESFWIDSLNLREVRGDANYIQRFLVRIPTSSRIPESSFFSNPNRIAGEKGEQLILMKIGKTDHYIGHYYYNF